MLLYLKPPLYVLHFVVLSFTTKVAELKCVNLKLLIAYHRQRMFIWLSSS